MPFLKLTEPELRDIAKRHIETLEFWLRRVADECLTRAGGSNYWEAEPPIVRQNIRERVTARMNQAPTGRFSRWVDATLLEHLIELLNNDQLYREHFKPYFTELFPANSSFGREHLKFILDKCAVIRNTLYHANPVAVRQVEQSVCYTNDIIDSIKAHYLQENQYMDFNAPSIITYSDSYGKLVHLKQLNDNIIRYNRERKFRVGDRIKMRLEIDSSFRPDSYDIKWTKEMSEIIGTGNELEVEFDESWIGELRTVIAILTSNKSWHRQGNWDDQLGVNFTILPPIE